MAAAESGIGWIPAAARARSSPIRPAPWVRARLETRAASGLLKISPISSHPTPSPESPTPPSHALSPPTPLSRRRECAPAWRPSVRETAARDRAARLQVHLRASCFPPRYIRRCILPPSLHPFLPLAPSRLSANLGSPSCASRERARLPVSPLAPCSQPHPSPVPLPLPLLF